MTKQRGGEQGDAAWAPTKLPQRYSRRISALTTHVCDRQHLLPHPLRTGLQAATVAAAPSPPWPVLDAPAGDVAGLLACEPDPFRAMAEMRIAGVILRGAFPPAETHKLIQRLIDQKLMRGPGDPVELTADGSHSEVQRDAQGRIFKSARFIREEYNGALVSRESKYRPATFFQRGWTPSRVDIGTSFGGGWADDSSGTSRSSGMEAYLTHSAGTHDLFGTLFSGMTDPVQTLYDCCHALSGREQTVMVAQEPDGRQ
jgi:hypothetical protein